MQNRGIKVLVLVGAFGLMLLVSSITNTEAQRPKPEVVTIIDGDTMYQVLPADAIPAITDPTFVAGKDALKQMAEEEPVIGLVIDGEARAYSLWHLDGHEIVNDLIRSTVIAVTW